MLLPALVRLLLDAGDHSDKDAALWVALENCSTNLVKLLIENRANVNARNENGIQPLDWALLHGHRDLAKLLVQMTADLDSKNVDGNTPFWWALKALDHDMIWFLIKHDANIQCENEDGLTPLLWAQRNHCLEIIEILDQHAQSISNLDLHSLFTSNPTEQCKQDDDTIAVATKPEPKKS